MVEPAKVERQKWLFSLDAYEDDAVLTVPGPDKTPQRRLVELADVAAMLAKDVATPWRWYGVSAGVVAVGMDNKGSPRWLVHRPAGPAHIRVDVAGKRQTFALDLPDLLGELSGELATDGQKWLGIERVFSFAPPLDARTILRACPLPNCYEDGNVCMGTVDEKAFRRLSPKEFLERAFIGTTFTDHAISQPLAEAPAGGTRPYENLLQMYRAEGGRVGLELLREVGTYAKLYT